MWEINKIVLLIFLLLFSISDIKTRHINVLFIYLGIVVGIVLHICNTSITLMEIIAGVIIGLMVMLISIMTKGIGMGDGFIISIVGLYAGGRMAMLVLLYSLFITGVAGLIMIIIKRQGLNKEIPFVPSIFISALGLVVF